jgi:hypothetical protein
MTFDLSTRLTALPLIRSSALFGVLWWRNIVHRILVCGLQVVNQVRDIISVDHDNRVLVWIVHLLHADKSGLSDVNLNLVWASLNRSLTHKSIIV